ncbi:MAG: SMC-Scp complex subunit ScpB [Parcubacteria group bacterium]|nr:SMC-Scp complex subunit ScpB [Parcubacteria group bacterium]
MQEENQNKTKSTIDAKIEALLFFKSEPVSIKKISELIGETSEKVSEALVVLENKLSDRGLVLMRKDDEVELRTSPEMSDLISAVTKEELTRDLGRAGLETLSIILYKGPISRREIDYIRGVNSNFILRNLLIRGLVERIQNTNDARSFLYKPTFEVLSFMGISKIEDLPEYVEVKREVEEVIEQEKKEDDDAQVEVENTETTQLN